MSPLPKPADLKSTLNLPRTAFPMKANLPQTEPRQLEEWKRTQIYRRIQEARAGRPSYVLHDGPPYPTGTIHLGTGLNKILKDMVIKSKTMAGFRAPYVPGWDCHGLPIETQVEKELGGKKGSVSAAEFRRMCREFALRYIEQHRRDFKRLGIFGQWEDPYLTMSNQYEAKIADTFVTFLEKGYVYRGLKPVYWCIFDSTALAEAEVEYEDHTSPSIWVKFAVVPGAAAGRLGENVHAVIWTTTPWTLPHNRALAFHPDLDYVVAETEAGALLVAAQRLAAVTQELGLKVARTRGPWKGRELEGVEFRHPFLDLRVPGVLADYVTLEHGTGIVHTAPGHGTEDFQTGQKYSLETYAPLDDHGHYLEGLPEYKGKTVFEANPSIVALLRQRGALLGEGKLTHSYPHCWRCHNPVIFRATEQWFIDLDHAARGAPASSTLRQRALEEIKKAKWTPGWGEERLRAMIAERPDWCISRQRVWGVPLVIFYCEQCNERLENPAALRNVIKWFEREGADAWFQHSAEELLPPGTRCKCGASRWRKESDILDVWFDSGSSHQAVLEERKDRRRADLYLEGPDQFRGWFQSSLLIGVGVEGKAPYEQVLTHGWTLDEHDVPMSKSLGNVVEPREFCEKWGADLLRLWVASQDFTTDVRMSDQVVTQLSEAYRKIRNTFRFALGNLADFDPAHDALPNDQLEEMDRWMLSRAAVLVKNCRGWYEGFEFHRVFHALHDFCVVDLSAFYFDILKDRLYTSAARSRARRSAQTAIYRIMSALVRLVAPILVFTAEDVWKHMSRGADDPESVHMALFPAGEELDTRLDREMLANWERLLEVRDDVLSALETARMHKTVASSLEASLTLWPKTDLAQAEQSNLLKLLQAYGDSLRALFIVSGVQISNQFLDHDGAVTQAGRLVIVGVQRALGSKCERCWNYSTHVGENAEFPTVCERCVAALEEIARTDASAAHGADS